MSNARFTYLITPENSAETPVMMAVTVRGHTISAFFHSESEANPFFNHCFRKPANSNFIHSTHPTHHTLHEHNDETEIPHTHIKHAKKIAIGNLKDFLDQAAGCKTSGPGKYLSHKVRKDMLNKFKTWYEKSYRANQSESNSDIYNNHAMHNKSGYPTIPEHVKCLNVPSSGCLPAPGGYTTPVAAPVAPVVAAPAADSTTQIATTSVVVLATLVGLFACKKACNQNNAQAIRRYRRR